MKTKVFIDGSEGTTGLRIFERFQDRDDIEILRIDPALRKDPAERSRLINASDITFLCLPDAAAKEAVSLIENEKVRIIDSSTAHRTAEGWAYGFPELSKARRKQIEGSMRVAVPGCHATGCISLIYPLTAGGILPKDYPLSALSLTGYSGGGKKMIAEYEAADRPFEFEAPREYGLSQRHKHLPEIKAVTGIAREPLFSPIVADYYSGMVVTVPLYADMLKGHPSPQALQQYYAEYYEGEALIRVNPPANEVSASGFLSGNGRSGWDGLEIFVTGNEERILVSSRFDNLGKGASGAAVQCLNIMTGREETTGLVL